jgi:hypothetical protein
MPLSRAYPRDQRREPLPAAAVQLGEISCHQMRTNHRLSLRAVQLVVFTYPESGIVDGHRDRRARRDQVLHDHAGHR